MLLRWGHRQGGERHRKICTILMAFGAWLHLIYLKREREREHSKWKIRDHHFMSQDRECSFHLLVALFSSIASNPHGHHLYHHDPHRAATPRVKVKSSSPLCPQFSWELQLILHLQLQFFPSSSESWIAQDGISAPQALSGEITIIFLAYSGLWRCKVVNNGTKDFRAMGPITLFPFLCGLSGNKCPSLN